MFTIENSIHREAEYRGLRMTADEYLSMPDDGYRYELVNGVVCMSPSPSFGHQKISTQIVGLILNYLRNNPIGEVVFEVDIKLADDLVYRPDVVYMSAAKAAKCGDRITEIPDLIVEVISPDSRRYDSQTKLHDYEAAGVGEYWLVDPQKQTTRFFVLREGRFAEVRPSGDRYSSSVLPGFELDLTQLRRRFA